MTAVPTNDPANAKRPSIRRSAAKISAEAGTVMANLSAPHSNSIVQSRKDNRTGATALRHLYSASLALKISAPRRRNSRGGVPGTCIRISSGEKTWAAREGSNRSQSSTSMPIAEAPVMRATAAAQ